jgi:ribonuclease HI
MRLVHIYSDGAYLPTKNKGGYGTIIVDIETRKQIELYEGYHNTTNNRMELMGVLAGLKYLNEPSEVIIFSDSTYVVNNINEWIRKLNRRRRLFFAKNNDLLEKIYIQMNTHKISAKWIRGHNGDPFNERCDELANMGTRKETLRDQLTNTYGKNKLK